MRFWEEQAMRFALSVARTARAGWRGGTTRDVFVVVVRRNSPRLVI